MSAKNKNSTSIDPHINRKKVVTKGETGTKISKVKKIRHKEEAQKDPLEFRHSFETTTAITPSPINDFD